MNRKSSITALILILVSSLSGVHSQDSINRIKFGLEAESMCFINNGYHGSFWIGKKGIRARFVIAKATFPGSITPKGFKDLTSNFYEVEIDRFLGKHKNDFKGIWYAIGSGYTNQKIISASTNSEAYIHLVDLHSGIGYTLNLYKCVYLNPWLGIDAHINRPKNVSVGGEIWHPRLIEPLFGAKLGLRLN